MKPDGAPDTTPQADVPLLRTQWSWAWVTIFHSVLHLFKYFFRHVFIVQKFFLSAKRVIRKIKPCINFPFIYPLQLKSSGHHQFLKAHPGICISPLSPVDWYCCRLTWDLARMLQVGYPLTFFCLKYKFPCTSPLTLPLPHTIPASPSFPIHGTLPYNFPAFFYASQ